MLYTGVVSIMTEEAEMKLYGGIDLHSTSVVTKLINEEDKVVYRKKQGWGSRSRNTGPET